MRRKLNLCGLVLVLGLATGVSTFAKDKWVKLGSRTVNHAVVELWGLR